MVVVDVDGRSLQAACQSCGGHAGAALAPHFATPLSATTPLAQRESKMQQTSFLSKVQESKVLWPTQRGFSLEKWTKEYEKSPKGADDKRVFEAGQWFDTALNDSRLRIDKIAAALPSGAETVRLLAAFVNGEITLVTEQTRVTTSDAGELTKTRIVQAKVSLDHPALAKSPAVWERHMPAAVAGNPGHLAYYHCFDCADSDVIFCVPCLSRCGIIAALPGDEVLPAVPARGGTSPGRTRRGDDDDSGLGQDRWR